MMEPPYNTDKVNAETSKCAENSKAFKNTRVDLGFIEYPLSGYYQSEYFSREDKPEVPENELPRLIQSIISNMVQGSITNP